MKKQIKLTQAEWLEISEAIDSKMRRVSAGEYMCDPGERRCWVNHLKGIAEKIGPDGITAAMKGVEAVS